MSITVSGLGSGMDYDSWIEELVAVKQADIDEVSSKITSIESQDSALSSIKSNYSSLLEAIKTFTNTLSTTNVFNQKAVTSSSEAVTASVSSSATAQNIKVSVSQLATATTAKSSSTAASYVDSSTKISDISEGAITEGDLYIYVNNEKQKISITSDMTMDDVVSSIDGLTGVSASFSEDGKLTIQAEDSNYSVTVGSNSDTTNFSNVMSLVRDSETGAYSSSKSIFDTNTSKAITSTSFANGSVTEGKFTIGNAEFEVTSSTTLDSLIEEINLSEDAGVTAYWDSNAGKLVIEADDEGAVNINIESDIAGGGSNFTYIMGLTDSTGQKLADNSQTLGTNAILTVNGTQITSSSNTVTSDISGLTGVTLTLNDETTSTATVAVTNDTTKVTAAITTLVNAINTVITNTDTATKSGGKLYGETILTSLRNNIRQGATASTGDGVYKTLASIGITTGKVGSTTTSSDTNKLQIDTDKLTKALQENPSAVQELLIGNSDEDTDGVLTKMETTIEKALDSTNGYFVKRATSFDKQISRLDQKVDRMTASLEVYEETLQAKFQAMDEIISGLKNQASIFDSYFNNNNDDEDS